jgi:hypothetical protein
MSKNEGNHGNYDVDYLSYVDSNFDRDDKSLDISPTPLSLLNFDMDHMPDSSNGSNNNDNNDAYNSNNCDRIGIGVLWGDMQSTGIMDNDNDVDKNLKKKKKKKLGIESSKLLSIEEKKRLDMSDLGCNTFDFLTKTAEGYARDLSELSLHHILRNVIKILEIQLRKNSDKLNNNIDVMLLRPPNEINSNKFYPEKMKKFEEYREYYYDKNIKNSKNEKEKFEKEKKRKEAGASIHSYTGMNLKYVYIWMYIRLIFLDLICPFSHAFFRMSLCVLRTHIESRFCNQHVEISLN